MELNSNEIEKILPHRYPFLLVDRILDYKPGEYAVGVKCVSANEMHFLGHFPGQHVMPGVLIMEALAQTGAVALLSEEENKGKVVFFGGIKNARFKKQVVPGDKLELSCEIITRRANVGIGKAVAKVDGKVAAMGELTFAIGDRNE
ncbi:MULTISPECIES: 3-hydroxyacyl-ACP dehydratase FabZ [Lachnospira]|jgi:3-hydroxyacyl-[acyl-carrier-protein] dehydratase|uniref:3-hydroxyacyl-[acyl-carrier-protein] dehydratase FabZ n=2 Tax=Lachnospira TaxID=28050 RepID=A0A1H5UI90_9FIRM|nr:MULTISPECIES: 3-hydroxyacyl-ACP dehydratase FabZ [Lachnospira]MCR5516881.1 3-hydroxyacyl-ACP dehydratase FabZ [Lachnospira sp.]SDM86406.1 3-hydroxyacyl-[acyl-carrier-protein] dehydratase [Lachnospira pectinoschiza]SEF74750.1 3-hydroxyacyl-[acyl-carrier-protein] dehydratase [Lachnospira multipara]